MKKKIFVIVLALILAVGGGIYLYGNGTGPASKKSQKVVFSVSSGESVNKVITNLAQKKLIKNESIAKIWAKFNKPKIAANTYELNKNMNLKEIFNAMSSSHSKYVIHSKLKVGEGVTIPTVARNIASLLKISEDEVISTWKDRDYLNSLITSYWFLTDDILKEGVLYPLEGYFYPDTYYINEEKADVKSITKTLLDAMDKKLSSFKTSIENSSLSVSEVITLTSVVEKESLYDKDQAKIAGVFMNRLRIQMPLQSDITVNYALQRTGVKVSGKMLKTKSPYNTYLNRGLPIGPVATIQEKTLKAVLNYEKVDDLYFFAKKDGTVIYSKTYAEHQKAVQENKWY